MSALAEEVLASRSMIATAVRSCLVGGIRHNGKKTPAAVVAVSCKLAARPRCDRDDSHVAAAHAPARSQRRGMATANSPAPSLARGNLVARPIVDSGQTTVAGLATRLACWQASGIAASRGQIARLAGTKGKCP